MAATKAPATATDVREWAAAQGIELGARGRIPGSVIDSFNKGRKGKARYTPEYRSN